MTEDIATTVSGADQLRFQAADTLEEAAKKLRNADLSKTSEDVQEIIHGVQDKMEHLKEDIGARYHEIETEYYRQVEPVEHVIQDHPIPSVLVALGVGFLFGMLIGKYRD